MVIKPTIGRVVWYTPRKDERVPRIGSQPLAAIVTGVRTDTCVNLAVFDANGKTFSQTSVLLWQDDWLTKKPSQGYAEWMPYQKGQAAKTEELKNTRADSSPTAWPSPSKHATGADNT